CMEVAMAMTQARAGRCIFCPASMIALALASCSLVGVRLCWSPATAAVCRSWSAGFHAAPEAGLAGVSALTVLAAVVVAATVVVPVLVVWWVPAAAAAAGADRPPMRANAMPATAE